MRSRGARGEPRSPGVLRPRGLHAVAPAPWLLRQRSEQRDRDAPRSATRAGRGAVVTIVMGIETSCDETGVGFVENGVLLGDALASSMSEHVRFGGVVPEIAAR